MESTARLLGVLHQQLAALEGKNRALRRRGPRRRVSFGPVEWRLMEGLGDPETMAAKAEDERKAAEEALRQDTLGKIPKAKKAFAIFKERIAATLEAEGLKPGKQIMVESAKRWKAATKEKSKIWAECEQTAKDDAARYQRGKTEALKAAGLA